MATRWSDPAWLEEADAWMRANLPWPITGEIEQPHDTDWSTALRVPTGGGTVWFKATIPSLAHEAAVTRLLSEVDPGLVPPPIAVDEQRGWMLLPDAGERLREVIAREGSLDRWREILPLYGGLQLRAAPSAGSLLAAGAPDRRLAVLPDAYAGMVTAAGWLAEERVQQLEALTPRVRELSEELAAMGIPETIQHDDLHDGQVFVEGGAYRLMDWGDACVSHPFFTMSVTLEGVLAWGLEDIDGSVDTAPFAAAYLEPFATLGSPQELGAALRIGLRLGWICRALDTHMWALDIEDEDDRAAAFRRAAVHLELFSSRLDRLGPVSPTPR